jgi:hypothetical protein
MTDTTAVTVSTSTFLTTILPVLAARERIEIRAFAPGLRDERRFARNVRQAVDIARTLWLERDVYVGVAARDGRGGKAENVTRTVVVWCDLDFKCFHDGETGARAAITQFPFPPSIVVATGHGLHCYWLLHEPYERDDEPRLRGVMRGINAVLGDGARSPLDQVDDLARVMRLPGTWNRKDPRHHLRVRVETFEPKRRYDLSDFEEAGIWAEAMNRNGHAAPLPDVLHEGKGRNNAIASLLGSLRRRGASEGELHDVAQKINESRCRPPLDSTEVEGIVRSIARYAPAVNGTKPAALFKTNTASPVGANDATPVTEPEPSMNGAAAPAPPFPIEVLPGITRRYADESRTALGVPSELVAVPLLVNAAAAIGRNRVIEAKPGWREPAVLYAAIVSPPGTAKTPAMSAARYPLDVLQMDAKEAHERQVARWEAEIAALEKNVPKPERPRMVAIFTTDATIEAIAQATSTSPGLVMVKDELVSWVRSCDAYRGGRGGDRQAWLSGWSGTVIKTDRKNVDSIYAPNPRVSVVGGVQPDMLIELADEAGRHDGFLDRLLWAWPESEPSRWTEDTVSEEAKRDIVTLFRSLRVQHDPPLVVTLGAEAKATFVEWFNDNAARTRHTTGLTAGMYAKLPAQALRLALILDALAHPDARSHAVSGETMHSALRLVEYFRRHAHRVLTRFGVVAVDASGVTGKVLRVLQKADGAWVNRTDLHQRLGGHTMASAVTMAAEELVAQGRVERRVLQPEGGGRPSEQYRVIASIERVVASEPSEDSEETEETPEAMVTSSVSSESSPGFDVEETVV